MMGGLAKDTEAFIPASRDRLCSGRRLRRVVKRYLPGCAPAVMAALLGLQPLAAAAAPDYLRYSIVSGKYASAVDVNVNERYAVISSAPDVPFQVASISGGPSGVDLGSLGGNVTRIRSLNSREQAVGESTTAEGALHAFLYSDGQTRDLTVEYGMRSVRAINDPGTITENSADSRAIVVWNGQPNVFGPPNSTAGGH